MNRQNGFTIVEIMVALAMSLLLIAGVAELFTGNRETYRVQAGMSRLTENARLAVEALRRDLTMAGYGVTEDQTFDMVDNHTRDGVGSESDMVALRYKSWRNCAGKTLDTPVIETRQWDVVKDANGLWNLRCNGTVIVKGVENMQLLYGANFDTQDVDPPPAGDPAHMADVYLGVDELLVRSSGAASAADVTPQMMADAIKKIVSVRFALLVNSVDDVAREPDTATYSLLDAPATAAATDQRRRRVYSGTAILRNRSQI